MTIFVKGSRIRSGGGGGRLRHNTRRTELDRLVGEFIRSLSRKREDVDREREATIEDGPCFQTRNLPDEAITEDPNADELAAHIYGWASDVAIAEERLEKEIKCGRLVSLDGKPPDIRSAIERARAVVDGPPKRYKDLSGAEKEIIRFRAFWEMRDQEESFPARRGRGSPTIGYEFVFSFDQLVSNREILSFIDQFLLRDMEVVFNRKRGPEKIPNPLRDLPAAITIHRKGTKINHAHLLLDCRDSDGVAAQIPPQVWRSFDVHAVRIWAERLRSPELLREHLEKKRQTQEWKREARERNKRGLPPNPKPERVADTQDQRFLKLRSQIHTDLKTLGLDPDNFKVIDRLCGYRSHDTIRQLTVEAEIARQEFIHALATGKELEELRAFSTRAEELRRELAEARAARERAGKKRGKGGLRIYYTDRQAKYLESLKEERWEAAQDDHSTRLLVGNRNYLQEAASVSRSALESFLAERERLKPEGQDGNKRRSLVEIDSEIAAQMSPSDRLQIDAISTQGSSERRSNHLEEMRRERAETEQKLTESEAELRRAADRDEWRRSLADEAIADAMRERAKREVLTPIYRIEIYNYLDQLAHERGDAELAQHLWEVGRSHRMATERLRETTEGELGREYVSRCCFLIAEDEYLRASGAADKIKNNRKSTQQGEENNNRELMRRAAVFEAAREYDDVRWAIVDECLDHLKLRRENVLPRFLPGEFEKFKEGVQRLSTGEDREEFQAVIKRVEEASQRRQPSVKSKEDLSQPTHTFDIQADPQARTGILRGDYLYVWAKFVEKFQTKQDYSAEFAALNEIKRKAGIAVAQYRREHGREPRVILDQEKHDFISSVTKRFVSYEALHIKTEVRGALVIGRSKDREPIDYPLPEKLNPQRQSPSQAQWVKIPRNPDRGRTPSR